MSGENRKHEEMEPLTRKQFEAGLPEGAPSPWDILELRALRAERDRLREALERIMRQVPLRHGPQEVDVAALMTIRQIAKDALNADSTTEGETHG